MEQLYNITKTAKILAVGRNTIYRWIESGKIKTIKVNGLTRIKESEIKRIMEGK